MKCLLCSNPAEPRPWAVARDGREYFRCVKCQLVWLSPAQRLFSEAEQNRYFEHRNNPQDLAYLEYLSRLANPVCALISPGARGSDYGAGPAEGMRALLEPRGYSITPYDPYFFPHADLSPGRYDFVLCNEALEHFHDPAAELARIDSIVAKGGVIGFSSGLVINKERFLNWNYRNDPTHVIFFTEETVRWAGQRFAWEILSVANPRFFFRKK